MKEQALLISPILVVVVNPQRAIEVSSRKIQESNLILLVGLFAEFGKQHIKTNSQSFAMLELPSSSFEPVPSIHFLAALDLRADVEQPFNCLIIQNCRAVQSMVRSMGWTFEDNMVTACSSAPHSQAAEGAIHCLCKQERKRLTLVRRWLSRTHAVVGRVIPGGWVMPVSVMKIQSLVVLYNHPHSSGDPPRVLHF